MATHLLYLIEYNIFFMLVPHLFLKLINVINGFKLKSHHIIILTNRGQFNKGKGIYLGKPWFRILRGVNPNKEEG